MSDIFHVSSPSSRCRSKLVACGRHDAGEGPGSASARARGVVPVRFCQLGVLPERHDGTREVHSPRAICHLPSTLAPKQMSLFSFSRRVTLTPPSPSRRNAQVFVPLLVDDLANTFAWSRHSTARPESCASFEDDAVQTNCVQCVEGDGEQIRSVDPVSGAVTYADLPRWSSPAVSTRRPSSSR